MTVHEDPSRWRCTWTWFQAPFLAVLGFCILWDVVVVLAVVTDWHAIGSLFGHIAIGVIFTYFALGHLLNQTTVELTSEFLIVRHHPLPWFGNREIRVSSIRQLYCNRIDRRTKSLWHRVGIVLKDGRQIELLDGLPHLTDAWYIEQQIENRIHGSGASLPLPQD